MTTIDRRTDGQMDLAKSSCLFYSVGSPSYGGAYKNGLRALGTSSISRIKRQILWKLKYQPNPMCTKQPLQFWFLFKTSSTTTFLAFHYYYSYNCSLNINNIIISSSTLLLSRLLVCLRLCLCLYLSYVSGCVHVYLLSVCLCFVNFYYFYFSMAVLNKSTK